MSDLELYQRLGPRTIAFREEMERAETEQEMDAMDEAKEKELVELRRQVAAAKELLAALEGHYVLSASHDEDGSESVESAILRRLIESARAAGLGEGGA